MEKRRTTLNHFRRLITTWSISFTLFKTYIRYSSTLTVSNSKLTSDTDINSRMTAIIRKRWTFVDTCLILNALCGDLNTYLANRSTIGDALAFTAWIGNERLVVLFVVSVNQFRRCIYEREREREGGRIDNLFVFQKEILRTPKLVCCIAGFGRVSFFCSLCKRQTRRYNG